ncbi:hypothetical protein D3C80_1560880 [compost metagenome]
MLVQRIGADGVVPHRIQIAHLIAFTVALQITGFLTQAIKALIFTTAQVVSSAVAVGVQQIGTCWPVIHQRLPFTRVIAIMPLQPQRLMHGDAQLFSGNYQRVALLRERPRRAAKSAEIFTMPTFPRNVLFWRNAPGFLQRQLAFALNQHAEQILFQHIQIQVMLRINQQFQMIR